MSTTETKTETRTHVEAVTEEVTLYECPGCGQFVEDDELMPVLVNVRPERAGDLSGVVLENHSQVCCRYCAASMWDFDPEETARTDDILRRGERVTSMGRALLSVLTPSASTLGVLVGFAVTILIGVVIFDQVLTAVDQAAFETATRDLERTELSPDFGAPLPISYLVPVFVGWLLLMMIMDRFPRP